MVYAAIALGHSFSNHKILLSVVFFIAFSLAMQAAGAGLSELPRPGVEAEFAPRPQPAARYDALYLRFLADHEAMAALYDSGAL